MSVFEAKVVEIFFRAGHKIECCVVDGDEVVSALRDAAGRSEIDCIVAGEGMVRSRPLLDAHGKARKL